MGRKDLSRVPGFKRWIEARNSSGTRELIGKSGEKTRWIAGRELTEEVFMG